MMSRRGARLAALLAPVALLLPTAAHADQVTVDDTTGDVKALNVASELGFLFGTETEGQPAFFDAPAETATDVTRTTIQHAKRVTVTTHFRDLVETAEHSVDLRIFTPEGRFSLSASRFPDGSGYAANLFPDVDVTSDGAVRQRLCRSVRGRYDVVAETVTVSFPASCIGKPKWIQVASGALRFQVAPVGDGSVNLAAWADDAFRPSLSEKSMGRSPKVRRG